MVEMRLAGFAALASVLTVRGRSRGFPPLRYAGEGDHRGAMVEGAGARLLKEYPLRRPPPLRFGARHLPRFAGEERRRSDLSGRREGQEPVSAFGAGP